jgi:hypothetical protein
MGHEKKKPLRTGKGKRYGKSVNKKEFEETYLISDTLIKLKNKEDVIGLFEKHIKCETFGADGLATNPPIPAEIELLQEKMIENGMYERNLLV